MSKKSRRLAKAAAAVGAAYLASKMGKEKEMSDTYFGGGKTGDASIAENIAQEARIKRSKGIGTSMDTDTEFKGKVSNLGKKGMKRKMEDEKMSPGASMPYKSLSSMFGFKGGGSVVTKGQGRVMKTKKTIIV